MSVRTLCHRGATLAMRFDVSVGVEIRTVGISRKDRVRFGANIWVSIRVNTSDGLL